MIQRVIYKGDLKGSYNLFPFSNLMESLEGKPIPHLYLDPLIGKKTCAWLLPETYVVSIDYISIGGNRQKTIAVVMGKEEERVRGLEKKIREAIARLDENLSRVEGRTA